VFKHSATKAAEYAQTARTLATDVFSSFKSIGTKAPSTPLSESLSVKAPVTTTANAPAASSQANGGGFWSKWGSTAVAVGGVVAAAGAAAGAAYYKKEDIGVGYVWAADHMKYVGNLWDEETLNKRLNTVIAFEQSMGVLFRTYVTFDLLP
jgi:hypothetical protein